MKLRFYEIGVLTRLRFHKTKDWMIYQHQNKKTLKKANISMKDNVILTLLLYLSFIIFMMVVSVRDLKTKLISDKDLIIFTIIHLTLLILKGGSIQESIKGAIAGFVLYYIIYIVVKGIYKQEAFGFGDVLLLSSIGIVLGAQKVVLAGLLMFYVTWIPIAFVMIKEKSLNLKMQIALAPSICAASLLVLFWGDAMISWIRAFIIPF